MMSNKLVSLIIVTTGKDNYLSTCLKSVRSQNYPQVEAVIIDNSPEQRIKRDIIDDYPDYEIYPGGNNLFYCQALNIGIKRTKGEFLLCLNDDVILDREFIREAVSGFSFANSIGMVSGKILRFDRKTIDSTGLFLTKLRTARERGYGRVDKGEFEKEEYIFGVNGAVAFYRREMLEDIKEGDDYFDSAFNIFYEDLDIAWRAQRKGWRAYYIPSALAYHERGGTVRERSGRGKAFARRYLSNELQANLIKNRYLAMIKNERFPGVLIYLLYILFYELITWTYTLLFKTKVAFIFVKDLKYFPTALRKRKLNKKLSHPTVKIKK